MNNTQQGLLAMLGACSIWGLSPIYYKALLHVPPGELLAHRTFWSFVVFAGVLALQGRLGNLKSAMATPRAVAVLAFAALMISINWGLFIISVQIGRVTETSLGYYIFPLMAVLFGVVLLRERLSTLQWLAIALATVAVLQLAIGLGTAPWISLILGVTFALYGLIKKRLTTGPVVSVTAEVVLLVPFAFGWLAYVHAGGQGQFGRDLWTSGLLAFSGVMTALPLILFSAAAQRVSMSTLGVMQYINPTLQFFCATVIFGEALSRYHTIAFALIWLALAIYSFSSWRQDSARRKSAMTSSVEPPV
ncbi:EamA family transporter RarD [Pelagimonas varians]|uniref:Putative DMT superfamily transporter inner membrane protein n=1 Tax=Pelagimonas varians TaxID=696760 RepID=A0A238KZR0_9RHOB|nr:EamA family transporter RarD [Pelagimonas varians]PYG27542.1 chloramphenicol-sensitive protein RarD [Pelagimonas varians]SMX48061.1 putative DMT superfamily transporter inner membrane protein [Pelagimonas varians]